MRLIEISKIGENYLGFGKGGGTDDGELAFAVTIWMDDGDAEVRLVDAMYKK